MRRFPLPVALLRSQCLVDVDAKARLVTDAIAGPFERQQSGEQFGIVEAVIELARRSARLEPGEVWNGGREMDRGGGADGAKGLWGIKST